MRVYFAEDDDVTMFLNRRLAGNLGLDAVYATNGRELLEKLDPNEEGLLFLDLNMPEMDGEAVLRRLSGNKNHKITVVVLVGGELSDEKQHELQALGCRYFIHKPLKEDKVRNFLAPGTA